ncbi:methyltransferase domain-containing protein [Candidatus Uhrbacteria bacterium]|nr:methyltransferase domain-containing protein [Candidatus Uhrbacteria bacterium]
MVIPLLKGGTALIDVPDLIKKIGIGPGNVVADLGCGGSGHFVAPTAALVGSSGMVYAVDIQKKVLSSLDSSLKLQHITNVKIVWSNLEDIGAAEVPDGSCDIAILANVLFQNKNHEAILSEAARMLKEGGELVVVDWKHFKAPFGPPDELRISADQAGKIAQRLGLKEERVFDVGDYHYALILKK